MFLGYGIYRMCIYGLVQVGLRRHSGKGSWRISINVLSVIHQRKCLNYSNGNVEMSSALHLHLQLQLYPGATPVLFLSVGHGLN